MPFTASIVDRVFCCVPDKVIRLGGASWLRPMGGPFLGTWERIRFGVLCAVTPNSTNNISDALFLIGLSTGTAAPGAAYSSTNFLGMSVVGSPLVGSTRTLSYTAGSGNPYYSCTGGVAFHKANNVFLNTSAASTAMLFPLAQTGYYIRRAIVIVDITKNTGGTGSTTINVYCNTTAASAQTVDFRPDHLFAALDQPGTPTVRGVSFTNVLSTTAVSYSPIGGEVDTFEIFWSNNAFPLEISAIGATVIRPAAYSDSSLASDTFESYATSSGSVAVATFLSGGSGWTAAGSVEYVQTYNAGTLGNSSNFAPQVYLSYLGTTNSPHDDFDQYTSGSVYSGTTVNQGSYWSSPAYVASTILYNAGSAGYSGNLLPETYGQYIGSYASPYDDFEQYATGTVNSGTTVSLGTYWTEALTVHSSAGNLAPQVYAQMVGTDIGPSDTFQSYSTNSQANPTITTLQYGTWWSAYGTIYSTGSVLFAGTTMANLAPFSDATYGTQGLAGTLYSVYDTFESYGTGTVVTGVTINAGSYWSSNGSIH